MDSDKILKSMKKAIAKVKAKNAIEDVLDSDRIAEMSSDSIPKGKTGVMSKKKDDEECACKGESEEDCKCEESAPMDKTEQMIKSIMDGFEKVSKAYLAKKDKEKKNRCWEGYEPTPGKKAYSEDSCQKKSEKPFHGYNKEKHSPKGGLSTKAREKYNKEEGANLKAPVSSEEAKKSPKKASRRKSFCARMSGVKGETSKDGKLTPKGAALKRWDC